MATADGAARAGENEEERHNRLAAEAVLALQSLISKARRENMYGRIGVSLAIEDGRVIFWDDRRKRTRK
jgi:hypothetical protein